VNSTLLAWQRAPQRIVQLNRGTAPAKRKLVRPAVSELRVRKDRFLVDVVRSGGSEAARPNNQLEKSNQSSSENNKVSNAALIWSFTGRYNLSI
jgi:hypothetical protein